MSIIPVICYNYLQNCSRQNSSTNSPKVNKNTRFSYSEKVLAQKEYIDRKIIKLCSRNNTRGGIRL